MVDLRQSVSVIEGLKCVECGSIRLRTIHNSAVGETVRRRKKCKSCGHAFWTVEIPEETVPDDESFDAIFGDARRLTRQRVIYDPAIHDGYDWRQIDAAPEYDVCREGLIRSRKKKAMTLIQPQSMRSGAQNVQLRDSGKGLVYTSVAREVLIGFVSYQPSGTKIVYKDGDRSNLKLENLEWKR